MITEEKRDYNRRYYEMNRDVLRIASKDWRSRNKEKLLEYDHKRNSHPERKAQKAASNKRRYDRKKEQILEYNRKHRLENIEAYKAYDKYRRKRDREKINLRNRTYWSNHPDKFDKWRKAWIAKNPARQKYYESKRRALELNARTDKESVIEFFSWIKNQDFVTCTYCNTFISGKSIHIDHIVPITRGGDNLPSNFAISCPKCNSSKSDNLLHEWKQCPDKFKRIGTMI